MWLAQQLLSDTVRCPDWRLWPSQPSITPGLLPSSAGPHCKHSELQTGDEGLARNGKDWPVSTESPDLVTAK